MSSQTVLQPPAATSGAALDVTKSNDRHKHARIFIGPMPEKILSQSEAIVRKRRGIRMRSSYSPTKDSENINVIREHAFHYFIDNGGAEDDWGDDIERGVIEDLMGRWKESEWGRVWKRRMDNPNTNQRWVGSSFETGNVLGVNILEGERPKSIRPSSKGASRSQVHFATAATTDAIETFVTAPSQLSPLSILTAPHSPTTSPNPNSPWAFDYGQHLPRPISTSSSTTPLIMPTLGDRENAMPSQARTEVFLRPALKSPINANAMSDGHIGNLPTPRHSFFSSSNARGNNVHYSDSIAEEPASPSEVLARTGSSIRVTSAGAANGFVPHDEVQGRDAVLKDRMVIRVSYSKEDYLGPKFDENQNRTGHFEYEDWGEFLVAWRKDRLEIYEDYSTPGKEWATGHKHLAFLVPLNSPRTKLYLYSFVDMTFCLACPPTPVRSESKRRRLLHRAKQGSNIFIFKMKSRTRAVDWIWKLWRKLGGQIPSQLDVSSPALDTRVRIAVPSLGAGNNEIESAMFSRDNVIRLCRKALGALQDWKYLIERPLAEGSATLELAWRMDTQLDWVWQTDDVNGLKRGWEVLSGLALKQGGKNSHLEIRLAHHFPTHVHLRDGTHLTEPPGIEGYLDRIKPGAPGKQVLYLVSHNGNLFSLHASNPHPPAPPGIPLDHNSPGAGSLRKAEIRRGTWQILEARGVTDMRNIIAVRRAFHSVARYVEDNVNASAEDEEGLRAEVETSDSDVEDEGGDESLVRTGDKPRLRMKRSFELVLKNGHIVRLEAHSRRVALEWIERLRALVIYWRHRHRIDAKEEMDIVRVGSGRSLPTPRMNLDGDRMSELPADPASLTNLSSVYNWCVLEDCRSILKGGKIFARKGLRGRYKYVQLFLVSGHLVQFHITPKASLNHRRAKRTINLLDAYVCSGYFAAKALPEGQYNPEAPPMARRYRDGLETENLEEETLFTIWYHPYPTGFADEQEESLLMKSTKIPNLSAKRKLEVFRTRSKLERDTWCWALNCEIEKIMRANKDREINIRDSGELIST